MVKHKGLCPSLKKSVEFDVKEIIELPTKRGIKYQVKGDFEGRTCSTFCSKAKAMELKKALGLDVMEAESEDGTGQAHQEEGVSPIENNVQPLAQGQEPMESMPVQETVSTPITNTSIGVEPIENLDLTDADALNNMTTEFDEAPQMVADIEIAPSEPEGDGRSIGNIRPMNEDVPLHAESEDGTGQAHQEEGVSPIENNVQPLAQGQEPMEAMPVQETVSTPITNTSIGVEPIDNLGLDGGADVIGSMITEFDDAPEILANFQIGMMQPFGEGRSIGNNTPMNPDVPLHAEEFKAEAEIEIIDPTDNTTLPTPPPVCFVDKIPPSVWGNLSVLEKIHYAETGDESILLCPNCGISKEQLRLQDGFGVCGDCAYQKYFAPSHWITEPMIVANITEDEIELSERLPADVDMPSMKNPQKDLQTMIVPYFVWDKIYTQFTGGIKAEQDLSGLNYVLKYHGMMKPQLDNAIEVAEGEYDIMFGAERYQAQVFKAENNQGYYLDAETIMPLTKKGKVRTMSGKPHTPRELKEDKDITPEEALMRKEMKAEAYEMPLGKNQRNLMQIIIQDYQRHSNQYAIIRVKTSKYCDGYTPRMIDSLYRRNMIKYLDNKGNPDIGFKEISFNPYQLSDCPTILVKPTNRALQMNAEDFDAETKKHTFEEGNSAVIRQLNSQFRRLRFLGMLLGDDVKSLNDLNKKMDMTHPSLYVENRSSDKSYLTWLTNEQITEELGLNKENLKQLHDEWGVKLGGKLQEMIFDLSYTIHDRMTSKQTHLSAESFDVEFDDWANQEMLTHGETVSFKEWAKEEGKKHGDMDLTDWAEEEEESHDERYEAENFEAEGYIDETLIWNMRNKLEPPAQGYIMFASSSPEINIPYLLTKGYDQDEIMVVEYGGNETVWIPEKPPMRYGAENDDFITQKMIYNMEQTLDSIWRCGDRDEVSIKHIYYSLGALADGRDWNTQTDYTSMNQQNKVKRKWRKIQAKRDELGIDKFKKLIDSTRYEVGRWDLYSAEENFEAEVVQYDVLKGKPNEGGVEYAEYISIHDSVNEAEKEARRESKNIAEDEAIYVVEERFDDETLESKPSNLMFSIEKPLMEDEMSDNFEAEGKRDIPSLKSVGLLLGIGALGAYLAPQNVRNFLNRLNK